MELRNSQAHLAWSAFPLLPPRVCLPGCPSSPGLSVSVPPSSCLSSASVFAWFFSVCHDLLPPPLPTSAPAPHLSLGPSLSGGLFSSRQRRLQCAGTPTASSMTSSTYLNSTVYPQTPTPTYPPQKSRPSPHGLHVGGGAGMWVDKPGQSPCCVTRAQLLCILKWGGDSILHRLSSWLCSFAAVGP